MSLPTPNILGAPFDARFGRFGGPNSAGLFANGRTLNSRATDGVLFIEHRGNCLVYPEETLEAYRGSLANGAQFIEVDCQILTDGALAVMHDDTVNRTTTSTGNVNALDTTGWRALVVDAGTFLGGAWTNYAAPLLPDVISEFGPRNAILVAEVKAIGDGTGAALLAKLKELSVSREHTLVNSFSDTELTQFINDNWITCLNFTTYTGDPTPAALVATGYDWIGVPYTAATAQMDALRSAGLKVVAYTINQRVISTPLLTHCDAIYSDDAIYLRGNMKRTTDPFSTQNWYHGMQAANSTGDGGGRGAFTSPNFWGYNMAASNTWVGALQGWANPMNGVVSESGGTLTSAIINFSVKFVDDFAADRFAWIGVMTNDKEFSSDTSGPGMTGYCFVCRKSGTLDIFRYTSGVEAAFSIGSQAGTAIADGATATYKITITPTNIKLERTDVATSLTVADTTHRGAYLHAGVKGIHGLFKDVSITFP